MITYLLNFTLCSAMLLGGYQLLLKNQPLFNFNRYYLLLSIVFSLVIPRVVVRQHDNSVPVVQQFNQQFNISERFKKADDGDQSVGQVKGITIQQGANYFIYIAAGIYLIITVFLLARFLRNLWLIRSYAARNKQIDYCGARLVLITDNLAPFTFLNYIFVNRENFYSKQIAPVILAHELAHVKHRHSLDIILIELIQAICWFNPLLIFYKQAIQLNHEFIADAVALKNNQQVSAYQILLLTTPANTGGFNIASRFNYSSLKKRMIMITKTTSVTAALMYRLAIIPIVVLAFSLFCTKIDAQQIPDAKVPAKKHGQSIHTINLNVPLPHTAAVTYPSTKEGASVDSVEVYKKITAGYFPEKKITEKQVRSITMGDRNRLETIYKQMSITQQKMQSIAFLYNAAPLPPKKPTQAQLKQWADAKQYGVWIDGKRVKNAVLANYKPADISQMFISRLTEKAVLNDKFRVQVDMMTTNYYETYRKKALADRYKSFIMFRSPV